MQIQIEAQNIKCNGCVSAIQTGLKDLSGVNSVEVDIPTGTVTVEAEQDLSAEIAETLGKIGYPPKA